MLKIRKIPFRGHGKRVPASGPVALTLVSAVYDSDARTLTLGFNQAVDVSAYDGLQINVNDGDVATLLYNGDGGATLLDAVTVQISLNIMGDSTAPGITLDATGSSGIVASEDAQMWVGAMGLALPFP